MVVVVVGGPQRNQTAGTGVYFRGEAVGCGASTHFQAALSLWAAGGASSSTLGPVGKRRPVRARCGGKTGGVSISASPSLLSRWDLAACSGNRRAAPCGPDTSRFCFPAAVLLPAIRCRWVPGRFIFFPFPFCGSYNRNNHFFFLMERNPLPFHNLSYRCTLSLQAALVC